MSDYVWVGIGGLIGSVARHMVYVYLQPHTQSSFPFSTLAVNIAGCFGLGVVLGWSARGMIGGDLRLFLATGLCGGFTTFSAFGAECFVLLRDGSLLAACVYVLSSILLGISATALAVWMVK